LVIEHLSFSASKYVFCELGRVHVGIVKAPCVFLMKSLYGVSAICLLFCYISVTNGLRFKLKNGVTKCIQDEAHKDVIVHGEYDIITTNEHKTNIRVRDVKKHILYQRDNIKSGKFAFTTEDFDLFEVCFESQPDNTDHEQEVFLNIKHGTEAKDFDKMAKAEKLQPIEVLLKKLEGLADEIVQDFVLMHSKSGKMRNINESTHTRVLYFSILSMVILIGFACWQVLYLRRYFKSKKLIE
ncbi:Transmembrane emp24 domain-containing protein 10, partial [Schistosoma japonicum]